MGKGLVLVGLWIQWGRSKEPCPHILSWATFLLSTFYLRKLNGEYAESKADQQVRSHVIYMDTELGHAIDSWVPIMPLFSTLIKLVAVCLFAFFL